MRRRREERLNVRRSGRPGRGVEHSEPRQVDGCGEQREVLPDAERAAHASAAASVLWCPASRRLRRARSDRGPACARRVPPPWRPRAPFQRCGRAAPAPEPLAHVHEHRVHEAGVIEVEGSSRVFPPQVEGEWEDRLAIAHAMQALRHHHDRHDARWDRAAAHVGEQIGEGIVGKEPMRFAREKSMDRRRRKPRLAHGARRAVEVFAIRATTQAHAQTTYLRARRILSFA